MVLTLHAVLDLLIVFSFKYSQHVTAPAQTKLEISQSEVSDEDNPGELVLKSFL